MRIRGVDTAVVEANFDWTLVRVESDAGLCGWGEAFFAPGLTAIVAELAELVVGADPANHAALMARLRSAASGAGSTGGAVVNALTGIDAALWDLNARALGVPLWQLLGGRFHPEVRAYADCHAEDGLASLGPLLQLRPARWQDEPTGDQETITYFEAGAGELPPDLERLEEHARSVAALGFDALKFDVDVPGLLPRRDSGRMPDLGLLMSMVDAVRAGAGRRVEIALDCHWRYDLATAQQICSACADRGILWLEDPLAPDNLTGLVELARRTSVPLAGGENLQGYSAYERLLDQCALTVVTPDLAKVGGVDQARLIAQVAAARGLAIAPHNIAGPVGTAFAGHVASTFPNLLAVEFHALDVPFFADLVDGPVIQRGSIVLGDNPGIGVEVVEEEVRRWSKRGEPVFGDAPVGGAAA